MAKQNTKAKRVVKKVASKLAKASATHKKQSKQSGNYTQPGMRKRLFNRIKASGKGGAPGQWSARKAQMLAKQYKAKGGRYKS